MPIQDSGQIFPQLTTTAQAEFRMPMATRISESGMMVE
jgi:hypothetical protein